ncbi:MAG: CopG family transcriptional regulator [Candidatus Omnitrophica bacterium]|nr:CopG family transcriptional regulator [Candidatus Omnitrophota bacterium]
MKKTNNNSGMPVGKLHKITDFLPPPEKLAIPEETKKITISLKKSSINFFKSKAALYHTKYQKMIRQLLDTYAMQYLKS